MMKIMERSTLMAYNKACTYGPKSQMEVHSGVFVQTERPKENTQKRIDQIENRFSKVP